MSNLNKNITCKLNIRTRTKINKIRTQIQISERTKKVKLCARMTSHARILLASLASTQPKTPQVATSLLTTSRYLRQSPERQSPVRHTPVRQTLVRQSPVRQRTSETVTSETHTHQ